MTEAEPAAESFEAEVVLVAVLTIERRNEMAPANGLYSFPSEKSSTSPWRDGIWRSLGVERLEGALEVRRLEGALEVRRLTGGGHPQSLRSQ